MKPQEIKLSLALIALVALGQVNSFFKHSQKKYDVFLGVDYTIYIDNIIHDIVNLITTTTLLYLLMAIKKPINQKIILPFFVISILDIADYFIAYKQFAYIKIPSLIIIITLTVWQTIKKKD